MKLLQTRKKRGNASPLLSFEGGRKSRVVRNSNRKEKEGCRAEKGRVLIQRGKATLHGSGVRDEGYILF